MGSPWWAAGTIPLADSDDREAWLRVRRRYFTGSEAAVLLDRHEYTDLAAVLLEKRTGESDFDPDQDQVVQGLLSEQFVAAYTERCWPGIKLDHCGQLLRDPGCERLAATPDYVTRDATAWGYPGPANVQLKFTGAWGAGDSRDIISCSAPAWPKPKPWVRPGSKTGRPTAWRWGDHGALPSYIWHQVQLEPVCLGVEHSFVVAYHRSMMPKYGTDQTQVRIYHVPRDQTVLDRLRVAAEAIGDPRQGVLDAD